MLAEGGSGHVAPRFSALFCGTLNEMSVDDLRAEHTATNQPLPRRGYLGFGVDAQPASSDLLHEGKERWIVSELADKTASGDAGLELGDDLIALNDVRILSLAELRAQAAAVAPGQSCEAQVLRNGLLVRVLLTASAMPLETLTTGTVELDTVPWLVEGRTVRLRAIWTHPSHATYPSPKAAVWLLPSAAWITQENPLDPQDPTFQLIDHLTSQGVATLRIDRSGLGDSEGPHPSTLDFDAELSLLSAGRAYFLSRTQHTRRCLYGRSLGGILAPLLAQHQPFDAIAVWGTSSLNWHEASLESVEHQRRLRGLSGSALEQALHAVEQLQRLVYIDGLSPDEARRLHPELSSVSPDEYRAELVYDRTVTFFQQLQKQELAAAWAKVSGEVLAVHAEYDIVVPQAALLRLVSTVGTNARFHSLLGVDHFMHQRSSLSEAVNVPWGGTFAAPAARLLGSFFADGLGVLPGTT